MSGASRDSSIKMRAVSLFVILHSALRNAARAFLNPVHDSDRVRIRKGINMPANLPPAYFSAEKEYKSAKTVPEKLAALEEMLAVMPHHKGTDKLRAGLTRKISQLKEQEERRAKTKRGSVFSIEKQGAAQDILIGFPNVGKSTILSRLTNASPEIADYPYTTAVPVIGMMEYEDIQVQVIDLPPLGDEVRKLPFYNLIRNSDLLLAVLDGSEDPVSELELLISELEEGKVYMKPAGDDIPVGSVLQKMLVIINKSEGGAGEELIQSVAGAAGPELSVIAVSAEHGRGIEELKAAIFRANDIIRIYTKIPGHKADMKDPYVLPSGSTVMDLATHIHHDFADNLQFSRVWGSARFEGQSVQRDFVLQDGDIVELHI
jgi:ribosome-interacting GTPase 1